MMQINNSLTTTSTTTSTTSTTVTPSLIQTTMSGDTRTPTVAVVEEATSPLLPFHTLPSNNSINLRKRFVYQFKDVNYVQKCNVKKSMRRKKIQILNDVCGELNSGELTAILGPSGAGKTTLLNVLAGFKTQCVKGEFIIDGYRRRLDDIRKLTSYIPQDFTMLDLLTVEETLKVSIDFKLPKTVKEEKKKTMTDDILKIINLESSRHTLVRHLSGGEHKRLSIGVELVSNPPIMFCDEPTSGLDSVASLQVITYLRKLAQNGRIVVCVIHQPSSRIMQLFDSIVVMSSGDILYSGSSDQMLDYFAKANFQCPQYYNPADFVVEVASDRTNLNIIKLIESNKFGNEINSEQRNQNQTKIEINNVKDAHEVCNKSILQILPRNHNSLGRQMDILIKRSIQTMARNMLAVQLRIVMHVVVAILLAIVYWQIGNDAAKVLTNVSCIFFVVLFIFFGNAMPSIFLSSEDTQVFLREHLNGWYSRDAYFLSKIFSDLPLQFICPTLLISIVYILTGQPLEIQRFAMCWSLSVLIAIIGHFIGLVLGCTCGMQMGVFLVPGLTIPFLIFSGFFIRIYEVPGVLRYVCDVSFFRYTIEGYLNAIYGYQRPTLQCLINFCYYKDPQKFLKDYGMSGNLYRIDFFALLMWIAALKLLYFLSLRWRIKKAQ